ncbi:MAG: hypothetical protein NZT92_21975, partial [Abditibacteriales bacterium]|nr:hypothetical protein [Abditibacteriales bacterium]MDW8368352.1 hypothetical protein [Abditibacteriales bacterium]
MKRLIVCCLLPVLPLVAVGLGLLAARAWQPEGQVDVPPRQAAAPPPAPRTPAEKIVGGFPMRFKSDAITYILLNFCVLPSSAGIPVMASGGQPYPTQQP